MTAWQGAIARPNGVRVSCVALLTCGVVQHTISFYTVNEILAAQRTTARSRNTRVQCAYTPDRLHVHAPPSSSSLFVVCHRDHDFSSGVSCFKIPDRFGGLAQWIPSIDNRYDLACFKQLFQKSQIFLVWPCCHCFQ